MCRLWSFVVLVLLLACSDMSGEGQEAAERVAAAWGEAYFNYDFERAAKYATPESRRWLSFAASNVYQADIDVLNVQENGASVEVTDYERTSDSTAMVVMSVRDFMLRDTIGSSGRMVDEAVFRICLVSRDKRIMVRMEGLPRSEKRSRD